MGFADFGEGAVYGVIVSRGFTLVGLSFEEDGLRELLAHAHDRVKSG